MISTALDYAGLKELFDFPLFTKAIGYDGKAGFIADFVRQGGLCHPSFNSLQCVVLIDDALAELEFA